VIQSPDKPDVIGLLKESYNLVGPFYTPTLIRSDNERKR
jgi:hypothetical protein